MFEDLVDCQKSSVSDPVVPAGMSVAGSETLSLKRRQSVVKTYSVVSCKGLVYNNSVVVSVT